jgi:hypothetical protein
MNVNTFKKIQIYFSRAELFNPVMLKLLSYFTTQGYVLFNLFVYVVIVCDTFDGTNAEHSLRTIQGTFSKKEPKEQP